MIIKFSTSTENCRLKIPIKIHGFLGAKPLNSNRFKKMNIFFLPKWIWLFKQKKRKIKASKYIKTEGLLFQVKGT
jgi:hypothetical protein